MFFVVGLVRPTQGRTVRSGTRVVCGTIKHDRRYHTIRVRTTQRPRYQTGQSRTIAGGGSERPRDLV